MLTEQWTKWELVQGLAPKYYLDSIAFGDEGLVIFLVDINDGKSRVRLLFKDWVHAYRVTPVHNRIDLIAMLHGQYGENFCKQWTFFKVINSAYVQWLEDESYDLPFKHMALVAEHSIIDIISASEPEATFVLDDSEEGGK